LSRQTGNNTPQDAEAAAASDWARPETVAVVGAGAWGTAIANLLAGKGLDVRLWVYEPELCEMMTRMKENVVYLPGVRLHPGVRPSSDLSAVVSDMPLVALVTPCQVARTVVEQAASSLAPEAVIVCCSKGIEKGTLMLLPDVLDDALGRRVARDAAFISGPSFAREVADDQPTSVAVAAHDVRVAEHVRQVFQTETFALYVNPDVTGIEVCGAAKNVIAIAVGICAGLGYGHNTRAAVITRGLGEIMKLGTALGANPLTFSGLAGFGDLVLTCTSELSRNTTLGRRLGQGEALDAILGSVHSVAEGLDTAKSMWDLTLKYDLDMPICTQVYEVLHENAPVADFVREVVSRDRRDDVGRVQLT
jgi:glycerol-3-phosphate dehydrogenase (NAD(P)+)